MTQAGKEKRSLTPGFSCVILKSIVREINDKQVKSQKSKACPRTIVLASKCLNRLMTSILAVAIVQIKCVTA